MRWALLVVTACSHAAAPPPAAPVANTARSCADAAAGLEQSTRGVRPPESTVLEAMRARCIADGWKTPAVDCFATMNEGDLGRCAGKLDDRARDRMFSVLGGGDDVRFKITIARARLESLKVGVAECDQFVTEVATVLDCEQMPIDARAALGAETADFWNLPTQGLSADAQHRMAEVCSTSLAQLQQEASGAGCP